MKIIGIGEILWDVLPSGEHLGGAVFNFAAHARLLGHEVHFVSAVGIDERGEKALARARELGLDTRFLRRVAEAPTGIVSVVLDAGGQPTFTIHRPAAYDFVQLDESDFDALLRPAPDWICYGTLHQMAPRARALTRRLVESAPAARRFYDINLRIDSFDRDTIRQSLGWASMAKLNDSEMREMGAIFGLPASSTREFCPAFAGRFGLDGVCVTLGARGCAILWDGEYVEAEGRKVQVVDTVGAGDAFSAALLDGLGRGWPLEQVAGHANARGAWVASRPGAIPA